MPDAGFRGGRPMTSDGRILSFSIFSGPVDQSMTQIRPHGLNVGRMVLILRNRIQSTRVNVFLVWILCRSFCGTIHETFWKIVTPPLHRFVLWVQACPIGLRRQEGPADVDCKFNQRGRSCLQRNNFLNYVDLVILSAAWLHTWGYTS